MDNMHKDFEPGTKLAKAFNILSDLQWHCGKHGLPGTQSAGLIREIVAKGYSVEKKSMFCRICDEENIHRRLVSNVKVR
jgi:hypothetical protein